MGYVFAPLGQEYRLPKNPPVSLQGHRQIENNNPHSRGKTARGLLHFGLLAIPARALIAHWPTKENRRTMHIFGVMGYFFDP